MKSISEVRVVSNIDIIDQIKKTIHNRFRNCGFPMKETSLVECCDE